MIEHSHTIQVRYADVDQMGIVHHSNYVRYFETARWELLRSLGIPYCSIEKSGYLLPVIRMDLHFIKATHCDAQLRIKTCLKEIRGVRIWFTYQVYNEKDELVNKAETELAFVDKTSWKPVPAPAFVKEAIARAQTG